MADSPSNDNTTCVVCFKNVQYYSIGECDHPVCYECSTRMRVLCLQNECPICRQDLSRVVFTDIIKPYKELRNQVFTDRLFERQFKIGFCTQEIKNAYDQLLENRCKICDNIPPFRTFNMLSDHMRKVHERHYCDLCVKNLKIFPGERKCYTRQELAHHRRKGDLDDTSHRGHPLCEFCEERFMDADELYRHLRKEHLYCHLCDADGRNLYYASHSALAQHFRNDHYLCEEGECAGQHLTAVFRSEIDLKAHKATVHGRNMPRGAARQARTLELQFNITPHPVVGRAPRDRDRDRDRERERERVEPPPPPVQAPANIDTRSDDDFPRLAAADGLAHPCLVLSAPTRAYRGRDGLLNNEQNFPALDGGAASSRPPAPAQAPPTVVRKVSKPSFAIQVHSQPASASNFRLTQATGNRISIPQAHRNQLSDDDFPSLGGVRDDHPSLGAGTVQQAKVTLINSQEMNALSTPQSSHQHKKPSLGADAFPALSSAAAPPAPAQWITVSKNKEKKQTKKEPTPPPDPRQPLFHPTTDFPTLMPTSSRNKKSQSIIVTSRQPSPPPAAAPVPAAKPTKKEKKKQNEARKENVSELAYVNGIDKKIARELSYGAATETDSVRTDKKIKTIESATTVNVGNRNGGTGDFKMTARDYPPLNPRADNTPAPTPAPYQPKKTPNGKIPSVPPGFKARPACDGMTFTNSSGQTFPAPVHAYIPPPNFEQRNRALVKKFAVALGGAAAVEDFKVASRAFRDNITTADEFYEHCRTAVGSQLDTVFPELVALLPDIRKQQELVVGRDFGSALEVCSTCGQLVRPGDHIAHDSAHWPALSSR